MKCREKASLYSSSRSLVLRGSGLHSGAVAAGVWAVPSLMAVTFLSSSSWLHCTAVDGACDSRHTVSALVRTQLTLTLYTLTFNAHTYVTAPPPSILMLPLRQKAHPDFLHNHLNIQRLQTTADTHRAETNHPKTIWLLCLLHLCNSSLN